MREKFVHILKPEKLISLENSRKSISVDLFSALHQGYSQKRPYCIFQRLRDYKNCITISFFNVECHCEKIS